MKMIKRNIKILFYANLVLFFVGITGLLLSLVEFNSKYAVNLNMVDTLTDELVRLENIIQTNESKLKQFELYAYKVQSFDRKYPVFSQILDNVYAKSKDYGFNPDLILGVIEVESNYNPTAVSNRGAYGLMQVNLSVWKRELSIDVDRIFEIGYNVDLGMKILKQYYDESNGNINRALHLYNNGYLYNNTKYVGKVQQSLFYSPYVNLPKISVASKNIT